MSITVASLWRHPIKSHGREQIASARLLAGQGFPFDRKWAVTHSSTDDAAYNGQWVSCQNFMIGTRTPALAGLWAQMDETNSTITLRHRDLSSIAFRPDSQDGIDHFINWVQPLYAAQSTKPVSLVPLPQRSWTDTDFPSISIMSLASHSAVEATAGIPIEKERWRGNIWIDGIAPWEELGWIGKRIRVGDAELIVRAAIVRCPHTKANPITGVRDIDTLGLLDGVLNERLFGIYAEVIQAGDVHSGDRLEVL